MHVHAKPPMPEQAIATRPQRPAAPPETLQVERISDALNRDGRGGYRNRQGSRGPRRTETSDEHRPTCGATSAFASFLASVDLAALDCVTTPNIEDAPPTGGSDLSTLISAALSDQ